MSPSQAELSKTILQGAITLIEEKGWVKGRSHIEGKGYCIVGAMRKAVPLLFDSDIIFTYELVAKEAGVDSFLLATWNDKWYRMKWQVVRVLKKALKKAEDASRQYGS